MTTPTDRLLEPREAADRIGVKTGTLNQWRWRGIGPAYEYEFVGHRKLIRYRESAINEWRTQRAAAARAS